MMSDTRRKLIYPALAGALYAALTMALAPISYGAVQFRVSEVLCVLPFFEPWTAAGLFLGCALANTLSAAGLPDIVFGSLATLAAGLCTARVGRTWRREGGTPDLPRRLLACLMPVLWNGAVVGAVLAWSFTPTAFWPGFWLMGGEVALGEAAVLFLLGVPAMALIPRLFRRLKRG